MDCKYIADLHRKFCASNEVKSLFGKIVETPTERRVDILRDMKTLIATKGLAYAQLALYRQQVNHGFVLSDPLETKRKGSKEFIDPHTGIAFRLQWNQDRELRNNRRHLRDRGIITTDVDEAELINKNIKGKACYLCKANIDRQNPGEVLLEIDLAGETFYLGANFVPILNNHFIIVSANHQPQRYRKETLRILNDFVDRTGGYFRALFNGLAGASIEEHEHLQATTEALPIEKIKVRENDVIYASGDLRVSRPRYYVPCWIIEGENKAKVEIAADRIARRWESLNRQYYTENIISTKIENIYRTFMILRDKRKLSGKEKKGAMGVFETGGIIVLSHQAKVNDNREINEKHIFDRANLETIKGLLSEISPEEQSYSDLAKLINFTDMGA